METVSLFLTINKMLTTQGLSVKEVEEPDGVYDTPSGIPVSQAPYEYEFLF